ncbi:hypothetical protein GOB94_13925 [Granulicella sp. 5B5]|uniref:hypothetical protein n=1 Tax=Granulicella sp. 5B5 TaxID=1617967 RepID=UPI0015F630D1|nr:hypothetical protein [Granulicella sp. 5B5]QMV19665.1 hypothetical protein GOB94_13925 [Granulicella sp. 5B5]
MDTLEVIWTKDEQGVEWVNDACGNKCSVAWFGSREAAEKSLRSLEDCDDCVNCSYCRSCSSCRYCRYCSDCSSCLSCSSCRYCSDCRYCRSCSSCSDCRYCSDCSYCSSCRYCSYCSDCSYCSYCSSCSYCRYCRSCSDCRSCSSCREKNGDSTGGQKLPPVQIPKIENIHAVIYEACSAPGALDMSAVHTCGSTHCRAGWTTTKAGAAGAALEARFGWLLAAMMIYRESGYQISPNKFFETDEVAMEDMRKLAEQEVAASAAAQG